jgi:hypothetical protein
MKKLISIIIFILVYNINYAQSRKDSSLIDSTKNIITKSYPQPENAVKIFYAEKSELIVIQSIGLNKENLTLQLIDQNGKFIQETILYQGSTLAYFDTQTLYNGDYTVKIISLTGTTIENVTVKKK